MVHWSAFELAVDVATAKLSGLTPRDIVKETGGCYVSAKVTKLIGIVNNSSPPDKDAILEILKRVPDESIRNTIAHSYMVFGEDTVEFIHRNRRNNLVTHKFTSRELQETLAEATSTAHKLTLLCGITPDEEKAFIEAVRMD